MRAHVLPATAFVPALAPLALVEPLVVMLDTVRKSTAE